MISNIDIEAFKEFNQDLEKKPITLLDYGDWVEKKVMTTGQTRLIENVLGLVGEAGEVAEKVKKHIRDGKPLDSKDIELELGDVMFYATSLANYIGSDLYKVLGSNVMKLDSREKRGTLRGSGDNR